MANRFRIRCIAGLCLLLLSVSRPLLAHPMGNFSINHYTRWEVRGGRLAGRYVLDMAEIPTVSEMQTLDADHDGRVSEAEKSAYLASHCRTLARQLSLKADGSPVSLEAVGEELSIRPGAGGLPTLRLTLKLNAVLTPVRPESDGNRLRTAIDYRDNNFPLRTGWKEIVVSGPAGAVVDSSVPATDISRELTAYPADPTIAPPQFSRAAFTLLGPLAAGDSNSAIALPSLAVPSPPGPTEPAGARLSANSLSTLLPAPSTARTPQDGFTQSISVPGLTPGIILLALGTAFVFGALHALSPGHGKAMVAAYLVGSRENTWHALLLGLVVTLTHTVGVFALGLLTLFASRWFVPEKLYPVISGVSGALVALMGLGLLWARVRAWRAARTETDSEAIPAFPASRLPDNDRRAAVSVDAMAQGGSENEAARRTDTASFYNQRRAGNPTSLRTLVGLGIMGGALPCPSALVVMLSAIALHRVLFGLLLIVSFSAGLAVVLTALGLIMVRARGALERLPSRGRLLAGLSVLSAGVVTAIGIVLFVRALRGGF